MRRSRQSRFSWKHLLISLGVIFTLYGVWYYYHQTQLPLTVAKKEAYALADKYGQLKTHTAFYWYNRQQTYFTVAGKNKQGQKVYVLIAKKGGKINIYSQNKGLSAGSAKAYVQSRYHPKKILKVALGLHKKQAVWEVSYLNRKNQLCYDLIAFKDGHVVKSIQNL